MTIYLSIGYNHSLKSISPSAYDVHISDISNDPNCEHLSGGDGALEQIGTVVNNVTRYAGRFDTWDDALEAARAYIDVDNITLRQVWNPIMGRREPRVVLWRNP